MNGIIVLLLVIIGLVNFYLCLQYGQEQQRLTFANKCEDESLSNMQKVPTIGSISTNEDLEDCEQPAPGMCNTFQGRTMSVLHQASATVPEDIFSFLHHPASPAKWNYYLTKDREWPTTKVLESPCQEVYMTRAGSRSSQPNKCTAVVVVPEGDDCQNCLFFDIIII